MDLVPNLVVQSCCEYVAAATKLPKNASRDRKTIDNCMLSAQIQTCLANVAGLRGRSQGQGRIS